MVAGGGSVNASLNKADFAVARYLSGGSPIEYGVDVAPSDSLGLGKSGTIVTHTLRVTNKGTTVDTFDIAVKGNIWPTTAPKAVGPLAAGAFQDIEVGVMVPFGAAFGTRDTAVIEAQSQGNNAVSDNSTLTTISARQVYLPIILK